MSDISVGDEIKAAHHRAAEAAPSGFTPGASLPRIDYASHPAFAAGTDGLRLRIRLKALGRFGLGYLIALARWIVDAEHMPKPPPGTGRWRWFSRKLPLAARSVLRSWCFRLLPRLPQELTPAGRDCLALLGRDGMMSFRLTEVQRAEANALLAPHFAKLEQRLAGMKPDVLHFDDNRYWVDPASDPVLYAWFESMLEQHGVLTGSSAYLKRPARVAHLVPQINRPEHDFWSGRFADAGVDDPDCNYFHVDTAHNTTKMIIYLGEVTAESGPFSFVAGSHRTRRDFGDRLIRRAVDHSGLSASDPATRALFAALPAMFRRKGAFGQDLQDGHPSSAPLLANERVFLSRDADCILFDPEGIHRGGMIQAGERRIVGVVLADRVN